MNKTFRRSLAASTVVAALAATMAATPFAVAGQAEASTPRAGTLSNFGYKGTAVGAKLYANNVQLISARDAEAPLRCSRKVGRTVEATSLLSAPENSLISLSGSTSRTVTYREANRYGVKAINTLGDIEIGGTLPGQEESTPIVTLKGLRTVADSFHTPAGYDSEASFSAPELTIDVSVLEESGVPIPPELTDLLGTLADTGGELTGQVIAVLNEAGVIEIPELGSIAMGRLKRDNSDHHAEADAMALEFLVTATGEAQRLQVGHARSRIGGPTPGGVFRSTSMPLEVKALDSQLHFGHVKPRTIPCEGTGGKTRTRQLDSASLILPSGLLMGVSDIDYVFMGEQHRDGRANGFEVSRVGSFEIPALELSITGITSRVGVKGKDGARKVRTTSRTGVAEVLYQGTKITVPDPGKITVIEGLGFIERAVVSNGNRWGKKVTALQVTLEDYGVVINLGNAAGHLFAY